MVNSIKLLSIFIVLCEGGFEENQISSYDFDEWHEGEAAMPDLLNSWIDQALPDVAYYLRQHKFNDFDRRYSNQVNTGRDLYKKFPAPQLRTLHWQVESYCSQGFLPCLRYLHQTVMQTTLRRSMDPTFLIDTYGWTWPRDRKSIRRTDAECKRLGEQAELDPEPFFSTLDRFQWRTSASYYMCMYTMKAEPWLSMVGDRCDNFASCLWPNSTEWGDHPWREMDQWDNNNIFPFTHINNDPRADDKKPFACALYSFCPDPCCPLRVIRNQDECLLQEDNPCRLSDTNNITCWVEMNHNINMASLTLNRFNVSCNCAKSGYIWQSRFGLCVDKDECSDAEACDYASETCINLDGSFACYCKFGFKSLNETCIRDQHLINIFEKGNNQEFSHVTEDKNYESLWSSIKSWIFQ